MGRISKGKGLVGAELPGVKLIFPTLLIAILPYEPSANGDSRPGVPGTDVGAVEYPVPENWEEYELS